MSILDSYILDLLHINDVSNNRLLNVWNSNTFVLSHSYYPERSLLTRAVEIANIRYGKTGNTVLLDSAIEVGNEQRVRYKDYFSWNNINGQRDVKELDNFVKKAYKEMGLKGNNPFVMGIGALRWIVEGTQGQILEIKSPILIYPIKLNRSANTVPLTITYVEDDVYVNPCLIEKLKHIYGEEMVAGFPHPNGNNVSFDEPVNLEKLGDGETYFNKVASYIQRCKENDPDGRTVFEFENLVVITQYAHNEICAYYDIKRNYNTVVNHPIVNTIFDERYQMPIPKQTKAEARFVLPCDSVQQKMIRRVVNGESLVIKGPPGTGKTLTIANMVAALMAANKKVLLVSQKKTALTEIYGKLPKELRSFAMLLEAENETNAAEINPNVVKQELEDLIKKSDELNIGKIRNVNENYGRANEEKNGVVKDLTAYKELMFNQEKIAGISYYEALDRVFKHQIEDIPVWENEEAKVQAIDREQYAKMERAIQSAAYNYDYLTNKGRVSIDRNPWMPLDRKEINDRALRILYKNKSQVESIKLLQDELAILVDRPTVFDNVGVRNFTMIRDDVLSAVNMTKVMESNYSNKHELATSLLLRYYASIKEQLLNEYVFNNNDNVEEIASALSKIGVGAKFTINTYGLIKEKENLLTQIHDANINDAFALTIKYFKAKEEKERLIEETHKVFKKNLSEEQLLLIEKAYKKLASYKDTDKESPKILDLFAKKEFKKLQPLSYLQDVTFQEVVKGVCDYQEACLNAKEIEQYKSGLARIFQQELSEMEIEAVHLFIKAAIGEKTSAPKYLEKLLADKDIILRAKVECIHKEGKDYLISELRDVYEVKSSLMQIVKDLRYLLTQCEIDATIAGEHNVKNILILMIAICELDEAMVNEGIATKLEVLNLIRLKGAKAKTIAKQILESFIEIGNTLLKSYYTYNTNSITFGDLKYFIIQATDNDAINAINEYLEVVNAEYALSLGDFLKKIEENICLRQNHGIVDIFEHVVFKTAIIAFISKLQDDRKFNLGKKAKEKLAEFTTVSEKIYELQTKIIEYECLNRIRQVDKNRFAFLNSSRDPVRSLRYLFKKNAGDILEIKRCFLLSPSSASVLFKEPELCDFDVLIMDESSQITPTSALSVLFRCKQCVLVGDEYQMPPIKRFQTRADTITIQEGGETFEFDRDTSILSLALANRAFYFDGITDKPVEELQCHYRSETETLIKFSQNRYYKYMRTFPSTEPKITIGKIRGLFDIYIPDGYAAGGVNVKEAIRVVDCIREHFDRNYDEVNKKLNASLGIVTFGENQLKYVKQLVAQDVELSSKISAALETFKDVVKEKLIFYKTIDTVQGQEADNLIISLTYGKTEAGINGRFGELNNSSLGECIFNVAVTRARSSVTFIHSIKSSDITNERVSFIREYLENVERFGKETTDQFVGESPKKGFLTSVGEFLMRSGIPKNRIVYQYGVTEGSIRVPIVVLSEDRKKAELGIWCELDRGNQPYFDANARHYDILLARKWSLHRLQAHDWFLNRSQEEENIRQILLRKNII